MMFRDGDFEDYLALARSFEKHRPADYHIKMCQLFSTKALCNISLQFLT